MLVIRGCCWSALAGDWALGPFAVDCIPFMGLRFPILSKLNLVRPLALFIQSKLITVRSGITGLVGKQTHREGRIMLIRNAIVTVGEINVNVDLGQMGADMAERFNCSNIGNVGEELSRKLHNPLE